MRGRGDDSGVNAEVIDSGVNAQVVDSRVNAEVVDDSSRRRLQSVQSVQFSQSNGRQTK